MAIITLTSQDCSRSYRVMNVIYAGQCDHCMLAMGVGGSTYYYSYSIKALNFSRNLPDRGCPLLWAYALSFGSAFFFPGHCPRNSSPLVLNMECSLLASQRSCIKGRLAFTAKLTSCPWWSELLCNTNQGSLTWSFLTL